MRRLGKSLFYAALVLVAVSFALVVTGALLAVGNYLLAPPALSDATDVEQIERVRLRG